MADELDLSAERQQAERDRGVALARAAAAAIPRGQPGECEAYLQDSPRLVLVAGLELCAPCRDKREKRR